MRLNSNLIIIQCIFDIIQHIINNLSCNYAIIFCSGFYIRKIIYIFIFYVLIHLIITHDALLFILSYKLFSSLLCFSDVNLSALHFIYDLFTIGIPDRYPAAVIQMQISVYNVKALYVMPVYNGVSAALKYI